MWGLALCVAHREIDLVASASLRNSTRAGSRIGLRKPTSTAKASGTRPRAPPGSAPWSTSRARSRWGSRAASPSASACGSGCGRPRRRRSAARDRRRAATWRLPSTSSGFGPSVCALPLRERRSPCSRAAAQHRAGRLPGELVADPDLGQEAEGLAGVRLQRGGADDELQLLVDPDAAGAGRSGSRRGRGRRRRRGSCRPPSPPCAAGRRARAGRSAAAWSRRAKPQTLA